MKPMLFLHIAWMKRYCGLINDKAHGEFDYMLKGGTPHEAFNFLPYKGHCYGYAAVNNGYINVKKLRSNSEDEIEDVLVVWTATHPTKRDPASGRKYRYIIGWYDGARVYAEQQRRPKVPEAKGI